MTHYGANYDYDAKGVDPGVGCAADAVDGVAVAAVGGAEVVESAQYVAVAEAVGRAEVGVEAEMRTKMSSDDNVREGRKIDQVGVVGAAEEAVPCLSTAAVVVVAAPAAAAVVPPSSSSDSHSTSTHSHSSRSSLLHPLPTPLTVRHPNLHLSPRNFSANTTAAMKAAGSHSRHAHADSAFAKA